MMIKKAVSLLAVCLLLFGFGLPALAEGTAETPAANNGALYGDYEDDWFDNGYEGLENEPDAVKELTPQRPWYYRLSIVPILIGAAVGAAAVALLSRSTRREYPNAAPFAPHTQTELIAQDDRLTNVTRTTRTLK